jgi:sporulation protein YlmC with PRC-barrel domain
MFIKAKEVIGNKVVTQSGQLLGKVVDFEIDTTSQNIIRYYTQGDLFGFLKEPLMINADQVIEIKKKQIIVEDAIITRKATKKKTALEYAK